MYVDISTASVYQEVNVITQSLRHIHNAWMSCEERWGFHCTKEQDKLEQRRIKNKCMKDRKNHGEQNRTRNLTESGIEQECEYCVMTGKFP